MIILTGANSDKAKDDAGNIYRNFSFRGVIGETVEKAESLGYKPVVYDLGNLGRGEPFSVHDESFAEKGYYERDVQGSYKSKSLFKPEMVKYCMKQYDDLVVYLDGDAQLLDNIDEVKSDDYDIGVTLRDASELENEWHQEHFEIVKYVNAGVIFFNNTKGTKDFLDLWTKATDDVGNDQKALNKLTCPDDYPEPYSVHVVNGFRIKFFPCKAYNYYYFEEGWFPNVKILHFKGPVRHFYPFNRKKRLYCASVIPVRNKLRDFIKKILPS
ncbi:MAG: putative nucleotide-diphospho-sugar transferase [Deltaproteobacteria bacterium]|nr:putative nucleotide-diphospho-sugar transferase [Deltaproteobacteria bacterium]